jgi:periplasmic copper chaperone A
MRYLLAVSMAMLLAVPAVAVSPQRADEPQVHAVPALRADEAWVRWLPAGVPLAGYVTLTNLGDTPLTIVGASSAAFHEVSLHRSVEHGGRVQMDPVEHLTIGAHTRLEFSATGYHFMLMQPSAPIDSLPRVTITLRFSDGTSLAVPFEIRGAAAAPH